VALSIRKSWQSLRRQAAVARSVYFSRGLRPWTFKEVGLEINVEKTKYMLLSRHQNVGQNRGIKIANTSFENVSQFKY
jgi:hypothetical protein